MSVFFVVPPFRSLSIVLLAAQLVACDDARPPSTDATEPAAAALRASPRPSRPLPAGVTPAMVAEGEELFATTCVACHGPDGAGTQLGPSLQDTAWIHADGSVAQVVRLIHSGVAQPEEYPVPMPPRGGGAFSDTQIRALAAYVATLEAE